MTMQHQISSRRRAARGAGRRRSRRRAGSPRCAITSPPATDAATVVDELTLLRAALAELPDLASVPTAAAPAARRRPPAAPRVAAGCDAWPRPAMAAGVGAGPGRRHWRLRHARPAWPVRGAAASQRKPPASRTPRAGGGHRLVAGDAASVGPGSVDRAERDSLSAGASGAPAPGRATRSPQAAIAWCRRADRDEHGQPVRRQPTRGLPWLVVLGLGVGLLVVGTLPALRATPAARRLTRRASLGQTPGDDRGNQHQQEHDRRPAAPPSRESRNVRSAGAMGGGGGSSAPAPRPAARRVRGAARVSAAVARQVAQVRVVVGCAGRISRRDAAQCPEGGVPALGMRAVVLRAADRRREDAPRLVDAAHRLGDLLAGVQVRVEALRQASVGARDLQRRGVARQRPGRRTDRGPCGWASGRFYRPLARIHRSRLASPWPIDDRSSCSSTGRAWSIAATSRCRR